MTTSDKCQEIVTKIDEALTAYFDRVALLPDPRKISLRVNDQLPLALAKAPLTQPIIAVVDYTPHRVVDLLQFVQNWQNLLGVKRDWHILAGELTTQELAGDIVSSASQTMHYFLQEDLSCGFIIPLTALDSRIPDEKAYQTNSLTLTVGESLPQRQLVTALVTRGYYRFATSLERGGMRIRGEQIDIWPPTAVHPVTLSWLGSVIESIKQEQERRTTNLSRITLRPVLFPEQTASLTDHLKHAIVFRPAVTEEAQGIINVIYDCLHTTEPFPLTATPLTSVSNTDLIIFYANRDRVAQYVTDHHLTATLCRHDLAKQPFIFQLGDTMITSEAGLIADAATNSRPLSYARGIELLAELTIGKPAVHTDHGIGTYEGLQTRVIGNTIREYLVLRYAAGDTLSVPVEYAHKVTTYLGDDIPNINRLGGTGWLKVKRQAQADAVAFAQGLLATASKRSASIGHSYSLHDEIDTRLTQSFEHELTVDQERAWQDVAEDLAGEHMMDRLIVGDVGFGKTEIALRAARHVIANGKQVALLAPTTLLVQQHSDTWRLRFPDLIPALGVVSRFSTAKQLAATRAAISTGSITMAIGTHGLLSNTTKWHDLGLVIIDEEQRFGVKHKEHFKTIRASVDFLSLSATPIPRTLSMALAGLKQLSVISTPPTGRLHVTTHVGRDTDAVLEAALTTELNRGGQAYVVAPKIRQLSLLHHRIKGFLPQARIAIIHGQLPPAQIAEIMRKFDTGELHILISSTIIENGIDLPNANTIIVTQATHFGLADLYQLRGRVGRRRKQGHAFFLYNQSELRGVQRQRLTALTEATSLGSGWSLAQRDLEIRGAGNLLGAAQSGSVNAVGAQLYLDLVREAVADKQLPVQRHDVAIQLQIPTGFPEHYIADSIDRTKLYQQLSRAGSVKNLQACRDAIIQTYGPLPTESQTLITMILLQHKAAAAGITTISSATISPADEDPYQKLIVDGLSLPTILAKLHSLGNWQVKNSTLQLPVDAVDIALVERLLAVLE